MADVVEKVALSAALERIVIASVDTLSITLA
jgi:hypothetical protein